MSILRRGIYSVAQGIIITIVILLFCEVVLGIENSLIIALTWGISETIGSITSEIIENRFHYDKNKRRQMRVVLIWAVLIMSIFILMILIKVPDARQYILRIQLAFSIPMLLDEFQT